MSTGLGLPYAAAGMDDCGYHLTCPVCGARCRPPAKGARTEDAITKGAADGYAAHWQGQHTGPHRDAAIELLARIRAEADHGDGWNGGDVVNTVTAWITAQGVRVPDSDEAS